MIPVNRVLAASVSLNELQQVIIYAADITLGLCKAHLEENPALFLQHLQEGVTDR